VPRPSTRALRILRNVLFVAAAAAVPGCSRSCEAKKEPTVVIVDDGGPQPRALKRPFDLRRPDSGVPLFRPRPLASADASDAVIE
jgi:hypothetical protein